MVDRRGVESPPTSARGGVIIVAASDAAVAGGGDAATAALAQGAMTAAANGDIGGAMQYLAGATAAAASSTAAHAAANRGSGGGAAAAAGRGTPASVRVALLAAVEQVTSLVGIGAAPVLRAAAAAVAAATAGGDGNGGVSSAVELTPSAQARATMLLRTLAAVPAAADGIAAGFLVQGLSGVAAAAAAAAAAGNATVAATSRGLVLGALEVLLITQRAHLLPGEASTPLVSLLINATSRLDHSIGGGGGVAAAAGTSTPGSATSFGPVSAVAVRAAVAAAGGSASSSEGALFATTFASLGFDPHSGGGDVVSGVGQLVLSVGGASTGGNGTELSISGLVKPVMVMMPGLPPSSSAVSTSESAGRRAACGWWDSRSGAYKTSGCVALPSTFPPGTAPAWPVDESVTSGAMGVAVTLPAGAGETAVATALALAWRLESVETLGCIEAFLACDGATHVVDRATNASDAARYYFASEGDEVGSGGSAGAEFMTCNSGVPATLRWYRGARCPLWTRRTAVAAAAAAALGMSPDRCVWDIALQTFVGAQCTSAARTSCLCNHLTDFAVLSVALVLPSPRRFSVSVVGPVTAVSQPKRYGAYAGIFAALCLLAGVGSTVLWLHDRLQRLRLLEAAMSPEAGFQELPGGVWTW